MPKVVVEWKDIGGHDCRIVDRGNIDSGYSYLVAERSSRLTAMDTPTWIKVEDEAQTAKLMAEGIYVLLMKHAIV